MVISGVLVHTTPDRFEQVKNELLAIDGVGINTVLDDFKIVVVIRSKNIEEECEVSRRIEGLEGVLGIKLAYHHFGEDEQK